MISQTAEYALRAIVFLADHHGESHTSDAISSVTKVPSGYLAKILQGLVRAKLVNSQRGPHGGFSLAVDKEELTVLDIIQAVDPIRRITICPLELEGHGSRLCPLHRLLDGTAALVQKQLGKASIASLLANRRTAGSHPLCEFPRQEEPNPDNARRKRSAG